MKKDWSIGLMTGTVNDGNIDVAAIRTDGEKIFEFGPYQLYPYENNNIRKVIFDTYEEAKNWDFKGAEPEIFSKVQELITLEQSKAVKKFLEKYNFKKQNIYSVGFHGQTILHRPPNGSTKVGKTKQLGDGKIMSRYLDLPVVCDFRSNDVANGGQGAPLAPIYHLALSKILNENSLIFLNIGGISNLTFIDFDCDLIAFDTGPGNAPIDDFVKMHKSGSMDKDGQFAKRGNLDKNVVESIMSNKYFQKPFPKSLDRFDFKFQKLSNLSLEDGCATITKIIALSISKSIDLLPKKPKKIILTGGGRKNSSLVEQINLETKINCSKIEDYGLRGDAIEAEAFAYLSVRSLKNLPLSFPLTTGVRYPMVGGVKCLPYSS